MQCRKSRALVGAALIAIANVARTTDAAAVQPAARPPAPVDTGTLAGSTRVIQIDAFLRHLAQLGIFSGQALIARHDSVLLNRGYGFADRAHAVPIGTSTAFDIASLAKQFTGAAVLRLAQDRRLALNDSIGRWLSDVPSDKRGITIAELATHTAGIPRELDQEDSDHFGLDLDPPRDSVVRAVLAKPLRFSPGSKYEYSNMGFVLLAAIVERAAGQPFQDYVRNQFFRPAGLTHTGFQSDTRRWNPRLVARAYADLYDDGSPLERPDSWRGLGGAGVVTTASDFLTWHRALRAASVLLTDPRARLSAPGAPDYAYGWQAARRADGTVSVVFHAGGHPRSFSAEFRYYPGQDVVVIVLCNIRHDDILMQSDIIANVSDYITGRDSVMTDVPEAGPPSRHTRITGTYAVSGSDSLVIWRSSTSELWLAPVGQRAYDLVYGTDSTDTRTERMMRLTRSFVDSVRSLRCENHAPHASRVHTYEIRVAMWPARWCTWQRSGAFRGLETLGVASYTYSTTRASVVGRLRFGNQVHVVQWLWDGDELRKSWSSHDVLFPASRELGSLPNGDFAVYDWFTGRTITLTIEEVVNGRVTKLGVRSGTRSVMAHRVRG